MSSADGAVSAVERALRQRARRTRVARIVLRGAAGGALALAAAGLVLVWRRPPADDALTGIASRGTVHPASVGGGAKVDVPDESAPPVGDPHALMVMAEPAPPSRLETGTRVSAPETSPVRIASPDGTVLTLDPGSILTVVDLGTIRRFGLLRGAVHAQVSKLARGERFIIDTADAEVEVRGTAFRVETGVSPAPCEPHRPADRATAGRAPSRDITSRVLVTSGIVSVRAGGREARLLPGESWPAPCASGAGDAPPFARHWRPGSPSSLGSGSGSGAGSSGLKAQNELFSAAIAARNAGDPTRAVRLFERLMREYPQSSLIEGAMAARMRLLAGIDPARAAEAAAAYAARFPDGFARTEAAALARAAGTP